MVITQKVDQTDGLLGFFQRWLEELARHYSQVVVICLFKGQADLPPNVRVLSLGKESGAGRLVYFWRFFKYVIAERKNYDSVFVHMNPEYLVLAGWLWRLLRRPLTKA